jgi:L-ascorbate metabolism protein UlaG (beta-lactamase superfamily)
MTIFILLVILIVIAINVVAISLSAPRYSGPVSDHFNGKQFINPHGFKAHGLKEVFKWMLNRKRGEWTENSKPDYGPRPLAFCKEGIRITHINHTTFLIQVDGINILTDPVWSKRVSPFTWAGPKRMRLPGIRFEDLPKIHLVLISHNHYDHLDIATMRTVFGAFHPKIVTPLGVKAFLDQHKINTAQDLDWWDETQINDTIKIQAVPAQHFSGRGTLDRDKTLWCGFVIHSSAGKIYFAGDTGYNDKTFREIGERLGPFDLSIIPIGAYKPNWFMSPVHVSPEEAVQIHLDVKSTKSIASHFGTFPLGDDGQLDPIQDLEKACKKFNLASDAFIALREGKPFLIV